MRCFFVIVYVTLTCFGCEEKSKETNSHESQLIPLDQNDTNYSRGLPVDTTFPTGWKIEYLIKDDTTKYHDLFIRWSKEGKSGLYFGENLLNFRTYFIPEYVGENDYNIFMDHGCSTSCAGLLVLNKTSLEHKDFQDIADYDISTNRVVWFKNDKTNISDGFTITITDLLMAKDTSLRFQNMALGPIKPQFIDTVIFKKNAVSIRCTLYDETDYYRQKQVTETRTINFK